MSFANNWSQEGALSSETTFTPPWPIREVQITNDSDLEILQFKLNASENWRSLNPDETATLRNVRCDMLIVNSKSGAATYRIWGLG